MNDKPIPVIRGNSDTLNLIFELYAACQTLSTFERTQEARLRAIPNGWRDLRLCKTLLYRLRDNLKLTMQPEKRSAMDRMGPRMRFKTWTGTEAVKTSPDEAVLETKELKTLLQYAHKECQLCLEQRCNQCPLGKTFDSVLAFDRDGRSWATLSFEK